MKATLTINNKQVEAEINEEELRAALGEEKRFRLGDIYWFVDDENRVEWSRWGSDKVNKARIKIHNAFKTEAEAVAKKMRRESMASRWEFVPNLDERIWRWDFTMQATYYDKMKCSQSHWNIGCVKKTKEECEAWAAKYAEYFKLPR